MLSAEQTRKPRLLGAKLALVGALCLAPGVFAVAQSALMPTSLMQAADEASPLAHVIARTQTAHRMVITAFGSSSTEGIGASAPEMSYPSRLGAELRSAVAPDVDVSVLNRGVGGDTIDDMMRRLPNIIAEHPDLVIWQIGSNDPLRGVTLEHFTARTLEGIATLRRAGIEHTPAEVEALVESIVRLKPFPEIPAALDKLRSKYQIAVLSNGDPDMLEAAKAYHGLAYDFTISVAEANAFKPHVATYTKAAEILGLRMDEILFVANHEFDCVGAKAAGMRAAFIDRRQRPFAEWPYQPDVIVPNMTALADMLIGA
jgi:2-haloalkanoic acid dehalogenase type II